MTPTPSTKRHIAIGQLLVKVVCSLFLKGIFGFQLRHRKNINDSFEQKTQDNMMQLAQTGLGFTFLSAQKHLCPLAHWIEKQQMY